MGLHNIPTDLHHREPIHDIPYQPIQRGKPGTNCYTHTNQLLSIQSISNIPVLQKTPLVFWSSIQQIQY